MTDSALVVEDRDVEPRVVGAIAGRPDDGSDAGATQIDLEWRGAEQPSRLVSVRWADIVQAAAIGPAVEPVEQSVHLQVGESTGVGDTARELGDAVAQCTEPTDDLDAEIAEAVQVD